MKKSSSRFKKKKKRVLGNQGLRMKKISCRRKKPRDTLRKKSKMKSKFQRNL